MTQSQENHLVFSLYPIASKLRVTGGKEIPFQRAMLSMRNTGSATIVRLAPHATLSQEGGSVQDITDALRRAATTESLPAGDVVAWDVYDLLLSAHPGVASKVHLWGYKAVLNWWITAAIWAEYVTPDDAATVRTPISKWKLRWTPANPPSEDVELSLEAIP